MCQQTFSAVNLLFFNLNFFGAFILPFISPSASPLHDGVSFLSYPTFFGYFRIFPTTYIFFLYISFICEHTFCCYLWVNSDLPFPACVLRYRQMFPCWGFSCYSSSAWLLNTIKLSIQTCMFSHTSFVVLSEKYQDLSLTPVTPVL